MNLALDHLLYHPLTAVHVALPRVGVEQRRVGVEIWRCVACLHNVHQIVHAFVHMAVAYERSIGIRQYVAWRGVACHVRASRTLDGALLGVGVEHDVEYLRGHLDALRVHTDEELYALAQEIELDQLSYQSAVGIHAPAYARTRHSQQSAHIQPTWVVCVCVCIANL
jgi:hypothetical protein